MSTTALLKHLERLGIGLRLEGEKLRYDAPSGAVTPEVLDALRAHKAELVEFLRETSRASLANVPPLEPIPRDSDLPLSFAQRRLWFVDKLGAGSAYNTRLAVRLSGALDDGALEESLKQVVRRHEVLRTTFEQVDGYPVQRIAREPDVTLNRVDLSGLSAVERDAETHRLAAEETRRPFDLARGPLVRARLIRLGHEEHVFLLVVHHIVFDGWSIGVLNRELSEHYSALITGEPPRLPELRVQYADFAHWQHRALQGDVLDALLDHWREELGEDLPTLELPFDRPRPAVQTFRGAVHRFEIDRDLTMALESLGRKHHTPLAITLLASFQVVLGRWTGQDVVVVGSPIANRNRSEIEDLIGFFVNTLVFRGDLSGDPTFTQFLERVRRTALRSYEHQDLPFERLVEEFAPERHLGHNPLFQVAFAVQNAASDDLELPGLAVGEFESMSAASRLDLEAHLFPEEGHGLRGRFVYNPDLFDASTIERLAGHYRVLLEGIAAEPEARLHELPLLPEAERRRMLVGWNDTDSSYPRTSSIPELFEEQVARRPDAVAVEFEGEALTYAELNRRANQVAHHLIGRGVGPEVKVGTALERSVEMVVGILGVLKAGGAYVPLDPDYPKSRLAYMLEDTRAPVLLTQENLVSGLPEYDGELVRLDADWESIAEESGANPAVRSSAEDLAYVIYTSGSTGLPKGVCVPHRGINRLVLNTDYCQVEPSDRVAQASNSSFDAATFEIWGALLNGARLIGISKDVSLSARSFAEDLREHRITTMFLTTALFNQLSLEVADIFASLRHLMFGGELVDEGRVRAVLEQGPPQRLLHVYGPTECTTFSTWYEVQDVPEDARTVPIGRPIANSTTFVLDRKLSPVPVGVPGELYVGGDGLAREYLNDPGLTAAKLVPDPFGPEPGSRLYRTGDRVRYLSDGAIEFLGRIDYQVKIRGFRIEMGEIETALLRHEAIREAVVLCREDEPGNKYLAAYVVAEVAENEESLRGELRESLRGNLPAYMVPTAFVFLESLPLNENGKLDRRALPAPTAERQAEGAYVAPRSALEEQIAAIWREVLAVELVGVRDNFFDLGGHSLLAMQVVGRVRDAFQVDLPLESFFERGTVEGLAEQIEAVRWARDEPGYVDAAIGDREEIEL